VVVGEADMVVEDMADMVGAEEDSAMEDFQEGEDFLVEGVGAIYILASTTFILAIMTLLATSVM
jgi:hypothetical protein